jgi:hypothetical protein
MQMHEVPGEPNAETGIEMLSTTECMLTTG